MKQENVYRELPPANLVPLFIKRLGTRESLVGEE